MAIGYHCILKTYKQMNHREKAGEKKSCNVSLKSQVIEEDDGDMDLLEELSLFTKKLGSFVKKVSTIKAAMGATL